MCFFIYAKQIDSTTNQHRLHTLSKSLLRIFPMTALCERMRRETSPTGLLSGVSLHCLSSFTDYTCVLPVTQRTQKLFIYFLKKEKKNLVTNHSAFLNEIIQLCEPQFVV